MPSIALITPLFPINREPYRGKAIFKTAVALQQFADVHVICPIAVYPPYLTPRYRYHRVDLSYRPPGINRIEYVEYHALPLVSRPLNGAICARRLRPHVEKLQPDLILSYWLYPEGRAAVQLASEFGKPVIVAARGSDLRRIQDPVTRMLVRQTVTRADYVLTVSDELRRRAVRMGVDPGRTRTIHNGCDQAVFHLDSSLELRRRHGIAPEDKVVLFTGSLIQAKGIAELLNAFLQLAAEDPNLHLVLIGEGTYRSQILSFVQRSDFGNRVLLVGQCNPPEVAAWMATADVFCLPSYSEGCPNVILEAMTCGCAIVATTVGGIPEITSPEFAFLVPPHDSARLAQALRSALSRSWDRQEISARFKRSWDKVAAETFETCEHVLSGGHKRKHVAAAPPAASAARRMRIAVVTPYFPIGGEPYRGHSAYQTLLCLQEMADVQVICPVSRYPNAKWLRPRRFRYRRADTSYNPPGMKAIYFEYPAIPMVTRIVNGRTCARYLRPYFKDWKPDVILNYWIYPEGFSAVRVGRSLGVPVVVGSIGSDVARLPDPFTAHLVRRTLLDASSVITVSDALRRRAIELGAAEEKVTSVLNGCDFGVFHPRDRTLSRRQLNIEPDLELLLYVGWISPTKGLVELTDAVAALAPAHPRLRVAMIGEGVYRPEMEARAAAAGCAGRFLFLGPRSSAEIAEWLGACDLFCLPSHSEGCPNVIVEAISSGRPVVATNVGGIPELVNERSGLLVPSRHSEALRQALENALSRQWDQHDISAQFTRSWDVVAAETYAVCARVIGETVSAAPPVSSPVKL
jgi:teichuronic acid biosynthesis glycosyltransferase TuaC